MAKGPAYYDAIYRKMINGDSPTELEWVAERDERVLPYIIGDVLDLGCGVGLIARSLAREQYYLGVDFSPEAIGIARAINTSSRASFACCAIEASYIQEFVAREYATVLLLEVLEHVDHPARIVDLALSLARDRVIVTVPRDMPGRAHVKPKWSRLDLEALLGNLSTCELFGGEGDDRWWLAVKEVEK